MLSADDLGWLAGLSDAEACFSARAHGSRPGSLILQYEVGLVREDVMQEVRRLMQVVTGPLPELYRDPPKKDRRAFYRCRVVRKDQVSAIVDALGPALNGKRLEARIEAAVLARVNGQAKYRATQLDNDLCALSQGLKRGVAGAAADAERLLGADTWAHLPPGPAWLAGMFDGDGSVSMGATHRDDHVYYQPFVNISASDPVALRAIKDLVGAMGFETTALATQKAKGRARPGHGFNIGAADAERFLAELRPHLRVKMTEVDVLVDVYRGERSREEAYPILRALKRSDEPDELLRSVSTGAPLPETPRRRPPSREYRRPTYAEMKERGLWSSEEARERLGGVGHAAWMAVTKGLEPDAAIGNKKYFAPGSLREHVTARLGDIVRSDARERLRAAMESWAAPLASASTTM